MLGGPDQWAAAVRVRASAKVLMTGPPTLQELVPSRGRCLHSAPEVQVLTPRVNCPEKVVSEGLGLCL